MSKLTAFLLLPLFLFSYFTTYSQDECSAATGFWSDLVEEHPFLCEDINNGGTLLIPAGVVVTVDEKLNLSEKTLLIVRGTLFFDGNTSRLDFPEGSGLVLEGGGEINTNVSNNSQRIQIGNKTYWTSKEGRVDGPQTYGEVLLPVDLLSFEARVQAEEQTVDLEWVTASEVNSDFFAVEHSADGHSFTRLGKLSAAGTSSENQYYQYRHQPLSPGDHYYRLRQVDFDGSASLSMIKAVRLDSKALFSLSISTDFNELRLRTALPEFRGNIRIFDYSGRLLEEQIQLLSNQEISLDISNYEMGTYVLQVESGGRLLAKPFVKMTS